MIVVIIPAFNEELSIAKVIEDIPIIVDEIVICDNNSTDNTAKIAKKAGATVVFEERKGYGYACLKALDYIAKSEIKPEIIVFMDGDYGDYPQELTDLIYPILKDDTDFVIGARNAAYRQKGAMTPQQIFGNWLATWLMKLFFKSTFTDLGPFRAIKYEKLLELDMEDKTFGWTVEMQLKALKKGLTYTEVPVKYRARIGESKVSGTVYGTIMAGYKILSWIFKYAIK